VTTATVDAPPARDRSSRSSRFSLSRLLQALTLHGLVWTVALAPLPLGSNRPGSWSLLCLAVGVLLVLWALARSLDRGGPSRLGARCYAWPAAAMAALLAWFALQAATGLPAALHHPAWAWAGAQLGVDLPGHISSDPQATLTATMRLTAYAGVFFLAMHLGRERGQARILLISVAVAAVAYAIYGLAISYSGSNTILWYERWAYAGSLTSSFVNRNSFATYAGCGLVVAFALLARAVARARDDENMPHGRSDLVLERLVARTWLPAIAVIVLTAALLASHSRAGLAATAVGLVVMAMLALKGQGGRGRRYWLLAAALLAAVVAVGEGTVFQRIESGGMDALGNRLLLYRDVVAGIAERPWLGHGYGAFETAFERFRSPPLLDAGVIDKAHNSYLEFAFEAGLPALALLLVLLASIVKRCLRGLAVRRRNHIYPLVAVAAASLVGVHALVDFSLQIPAVAVQFALLLGLGFAQAFPGEPPAARPGPPRQSVPGAG